MTKLPGFQIPGYSAEADLTGNQYFAVKQGAARLGVVAVAATTDRPLGVLQNTPDDGEVAEIMVQGRTKMVASAAIALGAPVSVSANGRAASVAYGTDTTRYVIGYAEQAAAAAGDIIEVYLHGAPHRAS